MRDTTRFLSVLVALVAFAAPSYAADEIGAAGTVAALQVYTPLADTDLQHHGKVTVKNTAGVLEVYRWGGVTCGTRVLTEAQVESLLASGRFVLREVSAGTDAWREVIEVPRA